MRILVGVLTLALGAPAANAVSDQLQCYKITNENLKSLKGLVDLDAPGFGVSPGCKLRKAVLYCVPAAKSVQAGTLFDKKQPIMPIGYAVAQGDARICYKVSCPAPGGGAADQTALDDFGEHRFAKLKTSMLCAPATHGTIAPPPRGFQIVTPEIEIVPNQKIAFCYYFRTPNIGTVPIKRWVSDAGPGIHHAIVYLTQGDKQPPGTLSAANCGFAGSGTAFPQWVYAADTPSAELLLPPDDGNGKPLAIEVPGISSGFVYMYLENTTADVIKTRVTLNAEALELGASYTPTATYLTYNSSISIPPGALADVETNACSVPAGVKFWRLSMHTHGQAKIFGVSDGPLTNVFSSIDWEHPGASTFGPPSFLTFTGQLYSSCQYENLTNRTITSGDAVATDEECVAVGYFFPAPAPLLCVDGIGPVTP